MFLECTCGDVSLDQWHRLMKGVRRISYKWLVRKIKRELPSLYRELSLDFYNPWEEQTYSTKTHYVLTHSAIEYFIRKE